MSSRSLVSTATSSEPSSKPPILPNIRLRPGEVKFGHSRNHEIRFGTRHNSLTCSRHQLTLPIATVDKRLQGLSTGYREGQTTAIFSQSFQQGTTPSGILKTLYLISGLPD